jgi:hypothetical protein
MAVANALAYYDMAKITAVRAIVHIPGEEYFTVI